MGTIVSAGEGVRGWSSRPGADAQFGRIAAGLGTRQPETAFQEGLRRFSYLLLWVAVTLTAVILVTNVLLQRSIIDSVLFALAIAVGITPPTTARRGQHQPGDGRGSAREAQGPGQAIGVHRRPR